MKQLKSFATRHAETIRWGAILLLVLSLLFWLRLMPLDEAATYVTDWMEGLGLWSPVVLGLLYVAATLLFIPGWVLTMAAGAVYGLLVGTITVSLASTTGAALAFLIARYGARDRVYQRIRRSPRLAAVDQAIGEEGWKIVALLRLSPAVPFNLQNYLYGVTAVRFWPCVLASWVAMLPGTFLYVYLGSLGRAAVQSEAGATTWEWVLRGVGLVATIAVTVYVARLARRAIRKKTRIEGLPAEPDQGAREVVSAAGAAEPRAWPWGALATAAAALVVLLTTAWAYARQEVVRSFFANLLGALPAVTSVERYDLKPHGPTFDHSAFDELLNNRVVAGGWVDYRGLQEEDAEQLSQYLAQLAEAPFDELGRKEKLALLINAYNAFTLRLILDYYPLDSIRDIPADKRWDDRRWKVGRYTWSLNEIEHEQIRPNFREPRIHFALVCAAIGCPPLRNEAYTGDSLDRQLADQAEYVHADPRWFQLDSGRNTVHLTELYKWYRSDFEQYTPSILHYAAQFVPALQRQLGADRRPDTEWIEYDWRLNTQSFLERRRAARASASE